MTQQTHEELFNENMCGSGLAFKKVVRELFNNRIVPATKNLQQVNSKMIILLDWASLAALPTETKYKYVREMLYIPILDLNFLPNRYLLLALRVEIKTFDKKAIPSYQENNERKEQMELKRASWNIFKEYDTLKSLIIFSVVLRDITLKIDNWLDYISFLL
ncbi:predicted protein [Naegleria gruberi]|uniref:Predicted protein n=1 Tax=Naegleria gruberi TaxID=5762 RepID=D2W551_NAEGR|nr:uncharacterized protein NAEGRDRAFT_76539 [Naegleria gruberi]EFC35799.1 predicted protein [Naegleria gruberi]|eukprot:XP_002668543.1 predicted protein [Naegleria gruberi strain NEG-M]